MEDYRLIMHALLRLSDIYLIAAEAALKKSTSNQNKADFYLNKIRKRAVSELTLKKRRKELPWKVIASTMLCDWD